MGQKLQSFSRFGRPKSAPIVHRKHAGTVPLPHRYRAASPDTAGDVAFPASGPIKMRRGLNLTSPTGRDFFDFRASDRDKRLILQS